MAIGSSHAPMKHLASPDDESFRRAFEALRVAPGSFDHAAHVTITRAWVMAVDHFMKRSDPCTSCAELVRRNPQLLDRTIMLTHYSAELLFSSSARHAFVAPDIQSIPPM